MISTFDLLDKSSKISIPKDVPEEDSISDAVSDQPLSSTEVPATTAPNSKETNKQRPKYIDIGFLDPSGVTENQPATPGTDLTPSSQHSSGSVVEARPEPTTSSGYVVEARPEPTTSSGYVVEARPEPTASSGYVVEAKSEPVAGSDYVVEARPEPTTSSGYVVEDSFP